MTWLMEKVSQRVQDCTKVSINEILNCQKINPH